VPTVNDLTTTLGVKLKSGTKSELKGFEDSIKNLTDGFKTLGQGIAGVISVMGIMRTMDFIQNISKATRELHDLGTAMDLPVSRMDAIANGFAAAGINANAMLNTIKHVRSALMDNWGYGTETAYRLGIFAGDDKTDDQLMDEVAAMLQREKNPRKRARKAAEIGITDQRQVRILSDQNLRQEMYDSANSGVWFSDEQLEQIEKVNIEYEKLQVHVNNVGKAFAIGAAGGMTKFYNGVEAMIKSKPFTTLSAQVGEGFAAAFGWAGEEFKKFGDFISTYKPVQDLISALKNRDFGAMQTAFGDMWKDFTETVGKSEVWKGMTDALKSVAVEVGHLIARGMKEAVVSGTKAAIPNSLKNTEKAVDALMSGSGLEIMKYVKENILGIEKIEGFNTDKLSGFSKIDMGSTGYLAQSTQVLNPNPVPIKQNISNDVSIQTFNAAPGQTFEEAVEDLRLKPTLQPYNQVR
jgi:hypothetical protein